MASLVTQEGSSEGIQPSGRKAEEEILARRAQILRRCPQGSLQCPLLMCSQPQGVMSCAHYGVFSISPFFAVQEHPATQLLLCLLMGWQGKHPTELPDEC